VVSGAWEAIELAERSGQRLAILSIAVFMIVGLAFLLGVNEKKARAAVEVTGWRRNDGHTARRAVGDLRFPYPRRRLIRTVMHHISRAAFGTLARLEVHGLENMPRQGPLIVVGNHFSFLDPAVLVGLVPWPLEFLGGFRFPNAPAVVKFIPEAWGYFKVFRGSASRQALQSAEAVLRQGGVVAVYPEGGSWAQVLRPARPGTAFLAARTGAPILPVGSDGVPELFSALRGGRRARLPIRVGEPFGPYHVAERGAARRERLEQIGDEIMRRIAALIPAERHGWFSADPAAREAARPAAIYPWDDEVES
jgi:1-acyl-sn-glycerol-3-phosphate acyltransferase